MIDIKVLKIASDTKFYGLQNKYTHKTSAKNIKCGDRINLESHVVITGYTEVGEGTHIFPFASIGHSPQDLKYDGELSKLEIGSNNVIREHVTMNPGTRGGGLLTKVGNDCLFMVGSHVAHDCLVGDNVVLVNNATLGGHVKIGDFAIIGGLAAVHQFVRIGRHSMIGGCSGVEMMLFLMALLWVIELIYQG